MEIFIDADRDRTVFHQLGFSAGGGVFDKECGPPEKAEGMGWTSGARVAARADGKAWYLELAIPRAGIGLHKLRRNQVLSLNVGRNRFLVRKEYMTWSPLKRKFREPGRFACLVYSPTPKAFAELEPELREGGRNGTLRLYLKDDDARRAAYAALLEKKLRQVETELKAFLRVVKEAGNEQVAAKLKQKLVGYERRFAACRAIYPSRGHADPAALAEAESKLQKLLAALTSQGTIWDAKLEWLLSGI